MKTIVPVVITIVMSIFLLLCILFSWTDHSASDKRYAFDDELFNRLVKNLDDYHELCQANDKSFYALLDVYTDLKRRNQRALAINTDLVVWNRSLEKGIDPWQKVADETVKELSEDRRFRQSYQFARPAIVLTGSSKEVSSVWVNPFTRYTYSVGFLNVIELPWKIMLPDAPLPAPWNSPVFPDPKESRAAGVRFNTESESDAGRAEK